MCLRPSSNVQTVTIPLQTTATAFSGNSSVRNVKSLPSQSRTTVLNGDLPPNTPMQLTPLRVREIGAFLKRRIGPKSVPIYWWRRN
jgi:hypothetical protein